MFVWNQSTKGCNIPQRTPEFVCSHTPKYGFPLSLVFLTFGFHSKSKEKPSTVLFRTWSQTLPLPRGLWGAPSPRSPPPPPPPTEGRNHTPAAAVLALTGGPAALIPLRPHPRAPPGPPGLPARCRQGRPRGMARTRVMVFVAKPAPRTRCFLSQYPSALPLFGQRLKEKPAHLSHVALPNPLAERS